MKIARNMSTPESRAFWESVEASVAQLEHSLNLAGKTREKCPECDGSGNAEPGRTDYDGHGSYWVPSVPCRFCMGGRREVPCSPALESAAIEREIVRLKERLRSVKKRAKDESARRGT